MFGNFSKEEKMILAFSVLVITCTLCRNCFICKWVPKLDGFRMYKEGFESTSLDKTAPLLNTPVPPIAQSNPLLQQSNLQTDPRHIELQNKINLYTASIKNLFKASGIILEQKQKIENELIEAEKKLYKIENYHKDNTDKLKKQIKTYSKDLNRLDKESKDLMVTYKQKNKELMISQNELNKYNTKK